MTVIYQPSKGYIYNSDTIFLWDFIKYFNPQGKLLDIGSGSGILGILLAKNNKHIKLYQNEIQKQYQFLSTHNALINNIDSIIYCGDFKEIKIDEKFDIFVTNPPFYHANSIKSLDENLKISRYQENLPLDSLLKKINSIIKPKSEFYMIYDAKQLNDIFITFQKYRFNITHLRFIHSKIDKNAKVVLIRAKKSSKSLLNIIPPLVVFKEDKLTKDAQDIYNKALTYTIKF